MSDSEDPFSRRKRKNTSTKRKKRSERLSFTEESESETDKAVASREGSPSPFSNRAGRNSTRRKPRNRPFGVPRQNVTLSQGKDEGGLGNEKRPDYSTQGLQLLREQTANRPKGQIDRPEPVQSQKADLNLVRGAHVHKPDGAQGETKGNAGDALADVRNVGFISLNRDITEEKLGSVFGVDIISACDPMMIDRDAANSDEDEWEREQLRRVGLPVYELKHDGIADARNTREIIEEEDMRLGARGETGLSVIETCLECISEELTQADNRISLLTTKTDAIQKSIDKSVAVLQEHDAAIAKSRARETFYATFSQFAIDASEMLAELQPKIFAFYTARMAALEQAALTVEKSLTRTTDEFDRTLDVSNSVVKLYENISAEESALSQSTTHSAEHEDSEYVFIDVAEQFKSLKHIAGLFRDWRRLFPEDYKEAYGDMSLGKISGAIAMGRPNCELLEWVFALPKNSRPYAIEASHACELMVVWTIANWKPSSLQSTKHLYKIVRDIAENVAPQGKEPQYATNAITQLFDAFLKRLGFESCFLLHACNDPSTSTELLRKGVVMVIANAMLMYSKCFESQEFLQIQGSRFLGLLFGDFLQSVILLSKRMDDNGERIEVWSEVIEAFGLSKSRFPGADIPQWELVRKEVRTLLELQPTEQVSNRMRICLNRIGV